MSILLVVFGWGSGVAYQIVSEALINGYPRCFRRIDNLKKFVDDLENGRLEPYLKSEPVPSDNNGPVTVAVAKNFDDVVTNNGKDTLLEFYAPWYVCIA